MKFAERILYVAAGAYFAAAFVGQGVAWRGIYYGSFIVGGLAALSLAISWLRSRQTTPGGN
ncbi:hypothetical protein SAMN05518849_10236 [Sphingobium sp. AP50]|uniref:hypothetical protein n=1 Tax=Sphingobium sp. AP50 TaxID=1884369 RepID=UPI0008AEDABE|nr:hypothetical protein [Sphingobium sp. AP50]SEI97027.1 hypothetical protein SAMN05518849_10236 [Sphingobium sp. AP50]